MHALAVFTYLAESSTYLNLSLSVRLSNKTECVLGLHECICQMSSKSVERFTQTARMWQATDRQTDRPRYGEICSYSRNRLR